MLKLIRLSIVRPTAVCVLFFLLLFFGFFSYRALNQELFPDMSLPFIVVTTLYPGADAYEVENSLSKALEEALSSLEGLKTIQTVSREGLSIVQLAFNEGTDAALSLQRAAQKINGIRRVLPEDASEPSLEQFSLSDLPILTLGLTSALPETRLHDLAGNEIKPLFEAVSGVALVRLMGGSEREIQVNLNAAKLYNYNLGLEEVVSGVVGANLDFPTGGIRDAEARSAVRLAGRYSRVEDIAEVVLGLDPSGQSILRVGDVAVVSDTFKEREQIIRIDAEEALALSVQKRKDANAVRVVEDILAALPRLEARYAAAGLKFQVIHDSTEFTKEANTSVLEDLFLAMLLVSGAMFLFLHSLRNMFIVIVAIPVSLISTFCVMYLLGFTLNLMSYVALSLVVGVLVDDAIVVLENIHRHLEMGKERVRAVYEGLREIAGAVTAITLVLVVVFLPIALTRSLVSLLLRQFVVVVAAAALFSLLVSFTLVPLLSSRLSRLEELNPATLPGRALLHFEAALNAFSDTLARLLSWSLRHRLLVFLGVLLALAASISLLALGFIGSEFARGGDRGEFYLRLELPRSASLEENNRLTWQAESLIRAHPWVRSTYTVVGSEDQGQPQAYKSEILVKLAPRRERAGGDQRAALELKLALRERLPGVRIDSIGLDLNGAADNELISLYLLGGDLEEVLEAGRNLVLELGKIPGVMDPKMSIEEGNPEIRIDLDKPRMARFGVALPLLGQALNTAFSGNTDARFRDGRYEYDINIRYDPADRRALWDVENFALKNMRGEQVRLAQFAAFQESAGPSQLERRNRRASVTLSSQSAGRPVGDIGEDIKSRIAELHLPPSLAVEYGGDIENQDEGFAVLGFALLVSLLLAYLLLVLLYDSYLYPFVILFSVPAAVIGALLALALTMETLSLFSFTGLIMLLGLVIKNAVIVVDFTNKLKERGLATREALLQAVRVRFRPILMTTLSMVLGMLPIALAGGAGAEWKNGMGWVLIGGLLSSMFLTLIIVPLVYDALDGLRAKLGLRAGPGIVLDIP
jgi:hydrophobe/amphiphile efflux-1 (HAE1) family protein